MKKLLEKFIILAIISMLIGHNATKEEPQRTTAEESVSVTKIVMYLTEYFDDL